MTPRIIPAVLSNDGEGLARLLALSATFAPYVQLDFMDGLFVPSVSATPDILRTTGLPVAAEAHLMVKDPSRHFAVLAEVGVAKAICHLETLADPLRARDQARARGLQFGIAVNPGGDYALAGRLVPEVDSVLFMAVEPGFYGSPFLPEVVGIVRAFTARHPGARIGLDGGVKEENLLEIAGAGVLDICVGSAIFRAPSPADAYLRLQGMLSQRTHDTEEP